jgi:competence protein ComEC
MCQIRQQGLSVKNLLWFIFILVSIYACGPAPAPQLQTDIVQEDNFSLLDQTDAIHKYQDSNQGELEELAAPDIQEPDQQDYELIELDLGADSAEPLYQAPEGMEVVFYDVGQGDAALLRFPGGSTMLIDGGRSNSGLEVILPHFKELHLTHLDYLVSTHPDADHCGGLDEIVYQVQVDEIWENGQTKDTYAWRNFSDAADQLEIPRRVIIRGDVEDIDGCQARVLNGDQGWADFNSNSLVISIQCEGVITLMTGDADQTTQGNLIDFYQNQLQADLVKIPHHGSGNRDIDFPGFVQAKIAVCSVGSGNSYGHPVQDVINEWLETGALFYRTDQAGTVTVTVSDGEFEVYTEH